MTVQRVTSVDPYDELPYRCLPIEWTAPERMALASLLHGGPRLPLSAYRVLELGCGNGANLLPQAYYRRHAAFVGIDGASSQIGIAEARRTELELSNVQFIHADFLQADQQLEGEFDYIIGHGIFSWVSDAVRDSLLRLCAERLRPGGLLYLNYNVNPGWKIRGMVRDFLLAQTSCTPGLRARAESAQRVAARAAAAAQIGDHPYLRLLANEFKFVCENDASYVAHEYLAEHNRAYWRSEFTAIVEAYGFHVVADADFNYSSGRVHEQVEPRLLEAGMIGKSVEDTVDFFCYRQLHSPLLTRGRYSACAPDAEEFGRLYIAARLDRSTPDAFGREVFQHESGYQVEAKEDCFSRAFRRLRTLWPRGARVMDLFKDVAHVKEDLLLLHRNGLIELRCVEGSDADLSVEPLKRLELSHGGYFTTAYHTLEVVAA